MKRSRPSKRAAIGIAAGIAAFAATAVLALTRNGGAGSAAPPLSALSSLGKLDPIASTGPLGPEGIPIPQARALAPPRPLANGQHIDGITCEASEQVRDFIVVVRAVHRLGSTRTASGAVAVRPFAVSFTV